jgi:hypothetical protein
MSSLSKYFFLFVGAALLGALTTANFLLEPSTGAVAVPDSLARGADRVPSARGSTRVDRGEPVHKTVDTRQSPGTTFTSSNEFAVVGDTDLNFPLAPSVPETTAALRAAPAALSTAVMPPDGAAPRGAQGHRQKLKVERDRKRRVAHDRDKARKWRQTLVGQQRGATSAYQQQSGYGFYGPQVPASRSAWGNGW